MCVYGYERMQVVPTNIEKEILTHPDVEDVGVIGVPDDVDGELPMAFVVLRPNKPITAEELVNYINGMCKVNFTFNDIRTK